MKVKYFLTFTLKLLNTQEWKVVQFFKTTAKVLRNSVKLDVGHPLLNKYLTAQNVLGKYENKSQQIKVPLKMSSKIQISLLVTVQIVAFMLFKFALILSKF